jgi:2-keto-4-pentenoate hydratase
MAPEPERIAHAAAALLAARRSGVRLRSLPAALIPRDEAEAYAIQRAQFSALGLSVGGWKSTLLDAATGTFAAIATSALLASPAELTPERAPSAGSRAFGIEPEIAFRMAHTLSALPAAPAQRRAAVIEAIGSAHAAIELLVSRFVDSEAVTPLERLADLILNEGLVLGPPCSAWRQVDLKQLPLQVTVGGAVMFCGRGGHPLNDPLVPLVWLAGALLEHGLVLEAGQVVTTGSCNGLRQVAAGASASADFGALGAAHIQF